ncbi:unnamed protein product [Rhizoctonia solani]|uniref:Uncharacterized protein n=1 Tax=Rhizoctonia solani TaxID=456999 RepID=A0A8H3B3E1_9AGAM|nr:unnamed protein product [Rhizoctonia solani]
MNSQELNSTDLSQSNLGEVRAYLPPFKPLLGSHTTAEANLITRKLITSSIMKETLTVAKPEYRTLSLYPIVESSVTMVNSSDVDMTIATIHSSLTSGRMYHRNRPENWNPKNFVPDVCDFIEDYRSSTIFDVIGSVGGLFALLQTAHMLLFGRPLFWGLFGAMTITPFGLLGRFSSSGFKQRLSEEYHGRTDDGTGTIKIDKFLRDFVIDFGPADRDLEKSPNTETMPLSAALVSPDDESTSKVVLLAQMSPDAGGAPRKEDDVGREPYP